MFSGLGVTTWGHSSTHSTLHPQHVHRVPHGSVGPSFPKQHNSADPSHTCQGFWSVLVSSLSCRCLHVPPPCGLAHPPSPGSLSAHPLGCASPCQSCLSPLALASVLVCVRASTLPWLFLPPASPRTGTSLKQNKSLQNPEPHRYFPVSSCDFLLPSAGRAHSKVLQSLPSLAVLSSVFFHPPKSGFSGWLWPSFQSPSNIAFHLPQFLVSV